MDHSSETLFLTRRMGFVKLAMRNGSPLVSGLQDTGARGQGVNTLFFLPNA